MTAQLIRFPVERRMPADKAPTLVLLILRQKLRLEQGNQPKTTLQKALNSLKGRQS